LFYGLQKRCFTGHAYNAQENLLADSVHYPNNTVAAYTSFTWNANNDIAQWSTFSTGVAQLTSVITAAYNANPDAYKRFGNWLYFLGGFESEVTSPALLSQDNVTGIDLGVRYNVDDTLSYQYQYDGNGFISVITITENNYGRKTSSSVTFYYE
jgi:YD repeat-containing protein